MASWTIEIDPAARREIDGLAPLQSQRILKFLYDRLAKRENPRSLGEPLKGQKFANLWKYRVGDFRVICAIEDDILRVLVVRVGHRREVYR